MRLDPRTPVLVGAGQVTNRPGVASPFPPGVDPPGPGAEPLELMVAAVRAAAADCEGAGAGDRLLTQTASLRVIRPLSWHYTDAATPLARRLGIEPGELAQSAIGGNSPQMVASASARAIAAGELDVVVITGAECMGSRMAYRRAHDGAEPPWSVQPSTTPAPVPLGTDRAPITDEEGRTGLVQPIHVYPLFEQAIRSAAGRSPKEHAEIVGALWARFSAVAAGNPWAWDRHQWSAEELVTPAPDNRMIATPYTKRMVAYDRVDQGAALLMCSVERAQAAGVPQDRWVFPVAGADAHDHWFITGRDDLGRSPAIAAAGRAVLGFGGGTVDDVAHVDLYSCFPCAVQMGAEALGLGIDDPSRPLTVTGGLSFFGGPINDYATHAIAQMAHELRHDPGSLGLVTALGWYATKHAVGLWSTSPPAGGFRWADVQDEVDALPRRQSAEDHVGDVTVETYTVICDRDGLPERAICALLTADGQRTWGTSTDPGTVSDLADTDGLGRRATVDGNRHVALH